MQNYRQKFREKRARLCVVGSRNWDRVGTLFLVHFEPITARVERGKNVVKPSYGSKLEPSAAHDDRRKKTRKTSEIAPTLWPTPPMSVDLSGLITYARTASEWLVWNLQA